MAYSKAFSEISKDDAAIAGGKGASLGEMARAGIPVPPGFVILADAFEQFLRETDLLQEIDATLHSVNHEEMHTVEQASEKIQTLILNATMPDDIASEIEKQFETLNTEFVAVRSSATAEDSSSAAWAGQLDSYLNTTTDTLLQNVQKCWASLFTPRAIFYRFEKDLHKTKISVAVVVQKMVQSEVSGIAFSVHPVTEDRNQLIIEGGFGLGEAIVSGSVTPDSYVIEKTPRRIIDKNITYQSRALWRAKEGGNEWRNLSEEEGVKPALSDKQALELAELILKIEDHYGFPCDIEWAYEAGQFHITQSRPITTLSAATSFPISEVSQKLEEMEVFKKGIWVERGRWIQPPFVFTFYSHWHLSSLINRIVPGLKFHTAFTVDGYAFIREEDEKKLADYIRGEYEKGTLSALVERIDAEGEAVAHKLRELIACDNRYLHANLREFVSLYKEFTAFFSVEVYLGEQVLRVAKEVGYVPTEAALFAKVHPFLRKTWIEKEADMMADIAREYIADKNEQRLSERLQHYVQDYRWIQMVKWSGEPISETYARKRLAEEMKNCMEGNYVIPHHAEGKPDPMVELGVVTAYWRAECAGIEMQTSLRMHSVLEAVAKSLSMTYEQALLLSPHEMAVAAEAPSTITNLSEVLKREKEFFSTVTDDGKELILCDEQDEYQKIKAFYLTFDESRVSDILHGIGAAPGLVKGKVRIINSMKDADTFEQGEILVAPETTPSFVPLMRKASAILTGKGGITSHAAIVSRELRKPCVIAIKDVTRILKDGDLVEVDADNGVVRILERGRGKRKLDLWGQRDFTLALLQLGFEAESAPLLYLNNFQLVRPYFVGERKNGVIGCFIDMAQVNWQKEEILKRIEADHEYVRRMIRDFQTQYLKIESVFEEDKPLTREALSAFMADGMVMWRLIGWWWAVEVLEERNLHRDLIDEIMTVRKRTEEFAPGLDRIMRISIENLYPGLGEYKEVVSLREVLEDSIPPTEELARRLERYLAMDNVVYTGSDIEKAKEDAGVELVLPSVTEYRNGVLKGTVAQKGRYTAKVSLVLTKKDADAFEQGCVLVASTTIPDFIHAIKKAGAIVADEGGIVSHAAITSRELKIPCVIGTKFATQVLHDGDLVEVDADNGVVRRLT